MEETLKEILAELKKINSKLDKPCQIDTDDLIEKATNRLEDRLVRELSSVDSSTVYGKE